MGAFPTKEEAAASLAAALGSFEAGRYWSVYATLPSVFGDPEVDPRLDAALKLSREKFFKLERQVVNPGAGMTMLVIYLPAGLDGDLGDRLAAVGSWQKSNEPKFSPELVEPAIGKGNPVIETGDAIVKGFNDWVKAPLLLVSGIAAVGLIIYAATRLKGSKS